MKPTIHVVGAGLAGSECALQLAERGFPVVLHEMREHTPTPAHRTKDFAELVCSNSFGSLSEISAPGQLKWEAEALGSFVLKAARDAAVPSGQALGVDREQFARLVTEFVRRHPRIRVSAERIDSLSQVPRPAVIATGPLTHEALAADLQKHFGGDFLYFFDAIAPIVDADSIDVDIAWKQDRYDKGTADYFNCPLNKDEYDHFIREVAAARKIEPKHFETTAFFEGCMPIEVMVERGPETLRFGPMKPVGLKDPRTGREPYAVVQLRQDNKEATAYNLVGFQTRMAYGEQTRILRLIPGLQNAEFLKLGSIHRNLYVNSPSLLNRDLSSRQDPGLFLAGQITGVEGYFESTCIGLLVARFIADQLEGRPFSAPPRASALGSLLEAITDPSRADHFQPTNINFGLLPPLSENEALDERGKKLKDKSVKKERQILKAQKALNQWLHGDSPTAAYPSHWWQKIEDPQKPEWEILPQQAAPPEVILSKRHELGLLSNLARTAFELDGQHYASLEALWQMTKLPEGPDDPRQAWSWPCTREQMRGLSGLESKRLGDAASAVMKERGIQWVSYGGERWAYPEKEKGPFYNLIFRAMQEKLRQNPQVREVLLKTRGLRLRPDHEFLSAVSPAHLYHEMWMEIRDQLPL